MDQRLLGRRVRPQPRWQWIDIRGLAAGAYVLEEEVNAEHFLEESDYSNNSVATTVTIP